MNDTITMFFRAIAGEITFTRIGAKDYARKPDNFNHHLLDIMTPYHHYVEGNLLLKHLKGRPYL